MRKIVVAKWASVVTAILAILLGGLASFLFVVSSGPRPADYSRQFNTAVQVRIAAPYRAMVEVPIPSIALGEGVRSRAEVQTFPVCIDLQQDQGKLHEESGVVADLAASLDSRQLTIARQFPSVYESSYRDRLKHYVWISEPGTLRIQFKGISGLTESGEVTLSLRRCVEFSYKDGLAGASIAEAAEPVGRVLGAACGVLIVVAICLALWWKHLRDMSVRQRARE